MAPSDLRRRLQLAEAYASQGRVDDAIAEFEAVRTQAEQVEPELAREASRRLRYNVATRHAERGELDQAIALFGELAREYPGNALVRYSIGVAHLLRGDLDDAQRDFERVIDIDPDYVSAYVNLATVHETRGELERAIEMLRRAVDLAPDSQAALRAQTRLDIIEGNLLAGEGNEHEAMLAFERALRAEPDNRAALVALAGLYRRVGDSAGERRLYEQLVRLFPDDTASRLRLGELYFAAQRHGDAYDQLNVLFAQQPQGNIAARARALMGELRGSEEGARIAEERVQAEISRLRAHLDAEPGDVRAWSDLGTLHFQRDEFAEALPAFEALRDLDPGDKRARYALGALYDGMGRFADSAREYAAAIEMETDEALRARVQSTLEGVRAKLLYVEGRYDEASAAFEEMLARDIDNGLAHFYLGMIYSQEEQTLRAVDAYQEVIRIVPSHVGARLNLASSYERLNREEDAIDEYAKILQANPPAHIAEAAQRAMDNARRRLRGFTANLSYLMAYDDNTNLSETQANEDVRSDLSFNLAYQYKAGNGLRWRFLFSPTYSTYHRGQFDYLNTTTTVSAGMTRGRYNLVGGFTHRTSEGLVTSSRIGRMGTVFAEGFARLKLPPLFRPWSSDRVFSNVSANLSYSDFKSTSSPFFSAYTSAAGISLSQPLTRESQLRAGYQYVINANKEPVGNDYAYTSHGVSFGWDYRLSWGGINANYGLTLFDYTHLDSFSQFTQRRRNTRHNLALGATWRFRPDITLFSTLSWVVNESNLPVGFILSSEDIIEGLQSSSLSDYERGMLSVGMTFNF
jgi:tetratricopeptide (TPR) repeat protein